MVTDHKPLLGVFGNTRQGSIRSDRIKDVWFEVVWRKGSTNPAFFMSRRGTPLTELPKSWRKEAAEFEKTVWFLQFWLYTEAISMVRIISESRKDLVLSSLKDHICN